MFWLISVFSLMPKGEIVGIKLLLPLVTTLIYINEATELSTQFPILIEHFNVNHATAVYIEQNSGYRVNSGNVKTSSVYRVVSLCHGNLV